MATKAKRIISYFKEIHVSLFAYQLCNQHKIMVEIRDTLTQRGLWLYNTP